MIWAAAGSGGAQAQQRAQLPPGAIVQPLDNGAGARLRENLTTLAGNPRSLQALIGAGRAALEMGDAEAALGFFARADEVDPRDARAKAGMASALVQMEHGDTALPLFAEAVALGAPEAEIVRDRGLAYDMTGDPRRAQQDYATALRRGPDAEVERRMALSLAISGQREPALRILERQLRNQDRAGWRTQAFVLALTGDTAGASDTAGRMMPAGAAREMAPFFARLASLSPSQKAMAVHFGRFPSDGRAMADARNVDTSADPGALALARNEAAPPARQPFRAPPAQPQTRPRSQPVSPPASERRPTGPRRRPDLAERPVGTLIRSPSDLRAAAVRHRPVEAAEAEPRRSEPAPETRPLAVAPREQPRRFEPAPAEVRTQAPDEAPVRIATAEPLPQSPPALQPSEAEAQPGFSADAAGADAGFILAPHGVQPTSPAPVAPPPQAVPADEAASAPTVTRPVERPDFDQIAALVASLPPEDMPPPPPPTRAAPAPAPAPARAQARPPATPARQAAATTPGTSRTRVAEPAPRRAARPAPPANPSRHWVQLATGANRASLPSTFSRMRGEAEALLAGRTAYTARVAATNRLLVGPFETLRAAQLFVNQLARHDIRALAWTSPAGQEIERLQARR